MPISAIESRQHQHLTVRNEINLSNKNGRKKFYPQSEVIEGGSQQPTPVLVTITMSNKSHLTTELDSKGSTKASRSSKTSRRRSSSYNGQRAAINSKANLVTKEDLLRHKKARRSNRLGHDAAENCGTVELIRLSRNKSSVASECVRAAGGGAMSIAMSRSGENSGSMANNVCSDNENNVSSSSSSQQLLDNFEGSSNKSKHLFN